MAAEPFVGRDAELRELSSGLEVVLSGQAGLFMVVGESGIGKTRLATQISKEARERGARVLWGRCWEHENAPALWPWIHALQQLDETFELPALTSSVGGEEPDRFTAFAHVSKFLRDHSQQQPLVLVLDDLHFADEFSLELLSFIARVPEELQLMLIGTYDEVDARRSPRRARLLATAAREATPIFLSGLDRTAVVDLFKAMTQMEAPEGIIDDVYRATGGNPFFVLETIRLFKRKGDIRRPDHSIGFHVPSGVREAVLGRVETLDPKLQEALSAASVIGREFDVAMLARILGSETASALDLLRPGLLAGIVEESSALGRYRFAHLLVRETLYEELPVSQRMVIHRKIAEELEAARPTDGADIAELAHHWFKAAQAGDPEKALRYVTDAADLAVSTGAVEEAGRLYRRALQLASRGVTSDRSVADLQAALDELSKRADRYSEVPSPSSEVARFAREGDLWTIEYGGRTTRLRHTKGLGFIAYLLARPAQEIHVLDLQAAVEGSDGGEPVMGAEEAGLNIASDDAGDVIDAAAREAYRKRLADLEEEMAEARSFNDPERAARAQEEADALVQQLAQAVGLGGRARKAGSHAERARIRIRKTVKDGLAKITQSDPVVGEHLTKTIRTGTFCSYVPDPYVSIRWET